MLGAENLIDLARRGGVVMLPLLACSIVSVTVILERWWAVATAARRSARLQRAALDGWQDGGATDVVAVVRRDDSPLGDIYRAVLSLPEADHDARMQVAARQMATTTRALKRYVWLLGTIGSLAPFIGLFGT